MIINKYTPEFQSTDAKDGMYNKQLLLFTKCTISVLIGQRPTDNFGICNYDLTSTIVLGIL